MDDAATVTNRAPTQPIKPLNDMNTIISISSPLRQDLSVQIAGAGWSGDRFALDLVVEHERYLWRCFGLWIVVRNAAGRVIGAQRYWGEAGAWWNVTDMCQTRAPLLYDAGEPGDQNVTVEVYRIDSNINSEGQWRLITPEEIRNGRLFRQVLAASHSMNFGREHPTNQLKVEPDSSRSRLPILEPSGSSIASPGINLGPIIAVAAAGLAAFVIVQVAAD